MVPYGHTTQHLDNHDEAVAVGQKAANALKQRYGTTYKVGNIAETICNNFDFSNVIFFSYQPL